MKRLFLPVAMLCALGVFTPPTGEANVFSKHFHSLKHSLGKKFSRNKNQEPSQEGTYTAPEPSHASNTDNTLNHASAPAPLSMEELYNQYKSEEQDGGLACNQYRVRGINLSKLSHVIQSKCLKFKYLQSACTKNCAVFGRACTNAKSNVLVKGFCENFCTKGVPLKLASDHRLMQKCFDAQDFTTARQTKNEMDTEKSLNSTKLNKRHKKALKSFGKKLKALALQRKKLENAAKQYLDQKRKETEAFKVAYDERTDLSENLEVATGNINNANKIIATAEEKILGDGENIPANAQELNEFLSKNRTESTREITDIFKSEFPSFKEVAQTATAVDKAKKKFLSLKGKTKRSGGYGPSLAEEAAKKAANRQP